MYLDFYGLRELPFELTANPQSLYLTSRHREALSNLQYGLSAAKTVTLLIGEAGTGKTTLLKAALASDRCRHVRCVSICNPALTRGEFIETLARKLGLSADAAGSKAILLDELEKAVREGRSRGEITALVVDEAQSLSTDLLEEIRLLANIETNAEKLFPLVLVGQPALAARLEEYALRQLKQRVTLRCEITPLNLWETAGYIASRVEKAGGNAGRLFTREAVVLIHRYSGGIPRTVSVICDNALLHGLALGRQPVEQTMILEVCRDFAFDRPLAELNRSDRMAGPGASRSTVGTAERGPQRGRPASERGEPDGEAASPPKFRVLGTRPR